MLSNGRSGQPCLGSPASPINKGSTFYMTPEEVENMRKTFKSRLKKCEELAGQHRSCTDLKSVANEVTMASLLSDFSAVSMSKPLRAKATSNAMVAFPVGLPYRPCTVPLQDLERIKISDLRVETHHRGRALTLQRVSPVVKFASYSWTVAEDNMSGETMRLEIHLHKSKHNEDVLESGLRLTLKEPYLALNDQGDSTLRIDHPSDLVVDGHDPGSNKRYLNNDFVFDTAKCSEAAKLAKESGNDALKNQDLPQSYARYSDGIQLVAMNTTKDSLAHDLYRNRAHVNLCLNRLDEAKSDAMASITNLEDSKHRDLDSKANFRAGCAAYILGEFHEANAFFEEQQRLAPDDRTATKNLQKAKLRLNEQTTGVFDFKKIKAGLSKDHPRADAANFTQNVEVRESSGRGRGLFATCDIDYNDIVLCEKAFCVVWDHEDEAWTTMTYDFRDDTIKGFPAGLFKAVVQKLLNNPSQIEKVMNLHGTYQGIGKRLIMRDGGPVVDTFQVHDIIARNAFGPGSMLSGDYDEEDTTSTSAGLWIWASFINHSCLPNVKLEYLGDLMVLRATRPIKCAEEITHKYDQSRNYDARVEALKTTWGFTCECMLCAAENLDGPALRKKRGELEDDANAFLRKHDAANATKLSKSIVKRLAALINNTYDDERYNNLPRIALQEVENWLSAAGHSQRPSASKSG